jgi:hypothetical protein
MLYFFILFFDFLQILPARIACVSPFFLVSMLKRILEGGGEGVVACARRSLYRHGRSASLVKFKVNDKEKKIEGESK